MVYAATMSQPFQGRLLSEWAEGLETDRMTRIVNAVRHGYPNTALLYIEVNASQFNGSAPKVTCKPKGKIIRVPDTYPPRKRCVFQGFSLDYGTWLMLAGSRFFQKYIQKDLSIFHSIKPITENPA